MFEELEKFIERCYERAKSYVIWRDIENCRAQAFGALEFATENKLVDEDEATTYWNDMWQKFQDLNHI